MPISAHGISAANWPTASLTVDISSRTVAVNAVTVRQHCLHSMTIEAVPHIPLSQHRRNGFTLIELLVVLLLLTITIGIVGINLGNNERDQVRDESTRLAALLQTARDEAILQGQILTVQFQPDGYTFLRVNDKGKLIPLVSDDTLRPRRLPDGMTLTVDIDGVPVPQGAGLIFEPSGQLPAFVLTLRIRESAWHTRNENGRIRALAPEALHAG